MARSDTKTSTKRKDSEEREIDNTEHKKQRTEEVDLEGKNPGNVIGGFKSTLSNPNSSEEAKEHAEKMIEQLGGDKNDSADRRSDSKDSRDYKESESRSTGESLHGKNLNNVIGGYKATLSNPKTSDEARKHAEEMLEELESHHKEGRDFDHVVSHHKSRLEDDSTSDEHRARSQRVVDDLGRSEHGSNYRRDSRYNKHGKQLKHVVNHHKSTHDNEKSSSEHKAHSRKMLDEFEPHHKEGRDIGHVIGGYKAALTNENTSEEAREHARKMLEELGADEYTGPSHKDDSEKNRNNVIGGYRATLSNKNSSEEAREHARKMLKEMGADEESDSTSTHRKDDSEKNNNHVMGGYKATLSNPNASEEAKEHARKMLGDAGADESTGRSTSSPHKADHEKNPNNVIGGLKGALKNPNNSEEVKEDIRAKLDESKVAY